MTDASVAARWQGESARWRWSSAADGGSALLERIDAEQAGEAIEQAVAEVIADAVGARHAVDRIGDVAEQVQRIERRAHGGAGDLGDVAAVDPLRRVLAVAAAHHVQI